MKPLTVNRRLWLAMLAAFAASDTTTAIGAPPAQANDNLTEIVVLSNRADLVSGADALVEIRLPAKAKAEPSAVRVDVDGLDVTSAFAVRADGRFYGLVGGLKDGANTITARVPTGPGARLVITNHPVGGPVFSGEQVQPWQCSTATSNPPLGPAIDAQCNAPTAYRYMYRSAVSNNFQPYDPASPPPAPSIATTTTDHGVTVPYIVRIERGTMNRGIHEIAVLFDPSRAWTAWSAQPQWNRKLVLQFGAGTSQQYRQNSNESVLNNEALSLGYAVANSSMMVNGQHANFVTAAETAMMMKERVVEAYGEIRFTIGQGNSGGALLQYLTADNYPGILDGLRPSQDWTENVSGAYREFADSAVMTNAFNTSALTYSNFERSAIGGWGLANVNVFNIENGRMPDYNRPDDGTNCAGTDSYHPTSNPAGVRCTFQDFMVSVVGRREDGKANLMFDNVGVQYGLAALRSGDLSPEKFVDVNARAGGFDVDGRWQPQRSELDAGVVARLHRSGHITFSRYLGQVPILAIRGTNNNDYHYPFRTYVQRARLTAANGDAENHVFWTAPPASQSTLRAMSRWLEAIESDARELPIEDKVAVNRPADVQIACWIGGAMQTDQSVCDSQYPYFREPRTVAGDAWTTYVMKCQLKPLDPADYNVTFTADQWATMQASFPAGVCDFSKPGVGFQPNVPWLSYAAGPGGQPLPAAPTSQPGDGRP
jgi:hypothetical protein